MKRIALFFIMVCIGPIGKAQTSLVGVDYDKQLNAHEADYLNTLFATDSFKFDKDKLISFAHRDYVTFITDKYHFFNKVIPEKNTGTMYRLLVLNESEKRQAGGVEAIVFTYETGSRKFKEKYLKREEIVAETGNRNYYHTHELACRYYPPYLSNLGLDSSEALNRYELIYFTQVLKTDLSDKKVAFFSGIAGDVRQTKFDYFKHRKWALSMGYYQGVGTIVTFNEKQRLESGYDYIIVFEAKYVNMDKLMAKLKLL